MLKTAYVLHQYTLRMNTQRNKFEKKNLSLWHEFWQIKNKLDLILIHMYFGNNSSNSGLVTLLSNNKSLNIQTDVIISLFTSFFEGTL